MKDFFAAKQLIGLGRVESIALSPDESWAAVAVERLNRESDKYVSDIWRVPTDGSTAPTQLTRGESRDTSPNFRADGNLGFLSNRVVEGVKTELKALTQIWILPAGGKPFPITNEPAGVRAFRFAKNADRIAAMVDLFPKIALKDQRAEFESRKKSGPTTLHYRCMPVRDWDHWILEARPHLIIFDGNGGNRNDMTPTADYEFRNGEFDISPDGTKVALTDQAIGNDRLDDTGLRLFT